MRLLAFASVLLAVTVPASAAAGPAARVKNTNGWIESVAMDGARVAYAVQGEGPSCTKVFVWNVRTQGGALVSGKGTCGADSTSTGGGVTEIAVAGTRLAWIVNEGGNTESADTLYTASLPAPHERRVANAVRTGNVDGTLTGSWLSGLVGSGDRIALNQFTTAYNKADKAYDGSLDAAHTTGALGVIDAARLKAGHANSPDGNPQHTPLVLSDVTYTIPKKAGWPR